MNLLNKNSLNKNNKKMMNPLIFKVGISRNIKI